MNLVQHLLNQFIPPRCRSTRTRSSALPSTSARRTSSAAPSSGWTLTRPSTSWCDWWGGSSRRRRSGSARRGRWRREGTRGGGSGTEAPPHRRTGSVRSYEKDKCNKRTVSETENINISIIEFPVRAYPSLSYIFEKRVSPFATV